MSEFLEAISPISMDGATEYMSVEAMTWVLEDAPDFPPHLLGVLMGLANKADKHGRGAWPGQALLAQWARKSDRAARNDLAQLEALGLIRRGDQSLVDHIIGDERPVVWDIAMDPTHQTERKHTSGPMERKPASGPSDDAGQSVSAGSPLPGGSALPAEGTGSTVPRDRKHTSADTSGDTPQHSSPTGKSDLHAHTREDAEPDQLFDAPADETKPKPRRRKGGPKADRKPEDDQADELTNAFWERYTTAQEWIGIRQVVRTALVKIPRDDVARALARLGEEHRPVSGKSLQIAYSQVIEERERRNGKPPRVAPGGIRPIRSTTDERVAQAQALKQRFRTPSSTIAGEIEQ